MSVISPKLGRVAAGKSPPSRFSDKSRFLVYYDGSYLSTAALRYACATASPETEIIAIYLPVLNESESLDHPSRERITDGKIILAGAIANARKCGREIAAQTLPCRVRGPALASLACDSGNDQIFLGVEQEGVTSGDDSFVDFVSSIAPCSVTLVEA